jgi:hypothetical protein
MGTNRGFVTFVFRRGAIQTGGFVATYNISTYTPVRIFVCSVFVVANGTGDANAIFGGGA